MHELATLLLGRQSEHSCLEVKTNGMSSPVSNALSNVQFLLPLSSSPDWIFCNLIGQDELSWQIKLEKECSGRAADS